MGQSGIECRSRDLLAGYSVDFIQNIGHHFREFASGKNSKMNVALREIVFPGDDLPQSTASGVCSNDYVVHIHLQNKY